MARRLNAEAAAAGDAFWRFSLAFYARPGVADALLVLQDRAGQDVNLILFGLWLAVSRQHRLDAPELAAAKAAIAAINATVAPLRRLRRRLKGTADSDLAILRRRIAGLELQAERRAQYRLAERVVSRSGPPEGDRLAAAAANLSLYLGEDAGSTEASALRQALAALIRAELPQG